jgi:hypothetical protein
MPDSPDYLDATEASSGRLTIAFTDTMFLIRSRRWPQTGDRHYIELALKATIEKHGAFVGVSLARRDHNSDLSQLFSKIERGAWVVS